MDSKGALSQIMNRITYEKILGKPKAQGEPERRSKDSPLNKTAMLSTSNEPLPEGEDSRGHASGEKLGPLKLAN